VFSDASVMERQSFDITFQHKITFSLKIRNQQMKFGVLPKYQIDKILPIYSISQYLLIKTATLLFYMEVLGYPSCYFVSD